VLGVTELAEFIFNGSTVIRIRELNSDPHKKVTFTF